MGTAWAWNAMCESVLRPTSLNISFYTDQILFMIKTNDLESHQDNVVHNKEEILINHLKM